MLLNWTYLKWISESCLTSSVKKYTSFRVTWLLWKSPSWATIQRVTGTDSVFLNLPKQPPSVAAWNKIKVITFSFKNVKSSERRGKRNQTTYQALSPASLQIASTSQAGLLPNLPYLAAQFFVSLGQTASQTLRRTIYLLYSRVVADNKLLRGTQI